jgi:hypothetical protein
MSRRKLVGRTCGTQGGKLEEGGDCGELGIDGRITLKLIIDKHNVKI